MTTDLPLDVHVGMRAVDDARCLIVETSVPANAAFELAGMRLGAAASDTGPLLVLSLEDPTAADLFSAVCADVVEVAAKAKRGEEIAAFLGRLAAWRRFLRERKSGLSREDIVGLIGELVILARLLDISADTLRTWIAPDDALHDFESVGHALEVKSTVGAGARVYISNLDQLDSTGLRRLDLVHIRFAEDPAGQSLATIISNITARLPEGSIRDFDDALLRRGLMPNDVAARTTLKLRTQSISAYMVLTSFPRLLRVSVPQGIADANYTIDVSALASYQTAVDTVFAQFLEDASGE